MEHFYLPSDLGWSYAARSPFIAQKVRVNGVLIVVGRCFYHNLKAPAFGLETWELAQLFGGGN